MTLASRPCLAYGWRVETEAREEIEATVAARRELGPGHDEQLIDGFLRRIESEIDRRIDQRVAERAPRKRSGSPLHPANLALCIPIVAVSGAVGGGLPGVIVAFIALVLVFSLAEFRR
jgi:hypothetical protein